MFFFSWIAKKKMHNHGKVFMAILLHPRKDSTFPKEEASAVSNQKTNLWVWKCFFRNFPCELFRYKINQEN